MSAAEQLKIIERVQKEARRLRAMGAGADKASKPNQELMVAFATGEVSARLHIQDAIEGRCPNVIALLRTGVYLNNPTLEKEIQTFFRLIQTEEALDFGGAK